MLSQIEGLQATKFLDLTTILEWEFWILGAQYKYLQPEVTRPFLDCISILAGDILTLG